VQALGQGRPCAAVEEILITSQLDRAGVGLQDGLSVNGKSIEDPWKQK
jgi:hypothetical protein